MFSVLLDLVGVVDRSYGPVMVCEVVVEDPLSGNEFALQLGVQDSHMLSRKRGVFHSWGMLVVAVYWVI
jgi:hypothetical protein